MNAPIIRGLRRVQHDAYAAVVVRMNAPIIRGLRLIPQENSAVIPVRMNAPIIRGLRQPADQLCMFRVCPDECPDY